MTFAFDLDRCSGLLDLVEIVVGEFDVGSVQVLLQAAELCGTWDRDDPGLLCQQPGQRDLPAGVAFLRSPIRLRRSTSAWFAFIASGVKRGRMLRKSFSASLVFSFIAPVRNPLPRGL